MALALEAQREGTDFPAPCVLAIVGNHFVEVYRVALFKPAGIGRIEVADRRQRCSFEELRSLELQKPDAGEFSCPFSGVRCPYSPANRQNDQGEDRKAAPLAHPYMPRFGPR